MNELDLGFVEDEAAPGTRRHAGRRRKERRRKRRGRLAIVVAFLVVAGILGGVSYAGYAVVRGVTSVPDYTGPGRGRVIVHIVPGQSIRSMAETLEKGQVVKSTKAFRLAASKNPKAIQIQPGYYRLNKHMAAVLALDRMLDPASRILARVTVPEGMRMSKVLPLLADKTHQPLAKFKAAARHPGKLGLPSYAHGRLEGYLFPATYDVDPGDGAADVLKAMVDRFKQEEQDLDLEAQAGRVGLTPAEVVTVASLLQAESHPGDFAKVARVVYNRLDKGMPLQFDSTVTYALGRTDLSVSIKDTEVDSPYNTYQHTGLPPGPIDSPGGKALRAALHPASGNWLYFVTTNPKTGETKFTADPEEFQKFKQEFKRNSG